MRPADVRFIKGMLFGILSMVGDSPSLINAALAICAIAYIAASAFTKEAP